MSVGARACGERGSVLLLTAGALVLIMASTALAVDIGKEVQRKRQDQSVADLAANDAAAYLGRVGARAATTAEVASSLDRNGYVRDPTCPCALPLRVPVGALGYWAVELGNWTGSPPAFVPVSPGPADDTAGAIRVTVAYLVHYDFIPGNQQVTNAAVATTSGFAQVRVGSFLTQSKLTTNPALTQLLNSLLPAMMMSPGTFTISSVGYQGLEATSLTLGELLAIDQTLGSPSQALSSSVAIPVKQIYADMSAALTARGDPNSLSAAQILNSMSAAASATLHTRLGPLFGIDTPAALSNSQLVQNSATQMSLQVLPAIVYAAQLAIADGQHLMSATIPVAVPGVASASFQFDFIEAPQSIRGNPSTAPASTCPSGTPNGSTCTAQVRQQLVLQLPPVVLPLLGATIAAQVPVYFAAAGGRATITSILCGSTQVPVPSPPPDPVVNVAGHTDTATAQVGLANSLINPTSFDGTLFNGVVGGHQVLISSNATASLAGTDTNLSFSGSFDPTNPESRPVPPATIGWSTDLATVLSPNVVPSLTVTVDGLSSGPLVDSVRLLVGNAVTSAVQATGTTLTPPLADVLGVRLGGADVSNPWWAFNTIKVLCSGGQLVQ
ncbi:MAG: hypothetical protein ACYDAD_04875 [Acidimicrobiales bacterium]